MLILRNEILVDDPSMKELTMFDIRSKKFENFSFDH